jgi:hypothetical protein
MLGRVSKITMDHASGFELLHSSIRVALSMTDPSARKHASSGLFHRDINPSTSLLKGFDFIQSSNTPLVRIVVSHGLIKHQGVGIRLLSRGFVWESPDNYTSS